MVRWIVSSSPKIESTGWPGARQADQNSASQAYRVSTGFLIQWAHSYLVMHASSVTCHLAYSQRNQKACSCWEALMLQASTSRRANKPLKSIRWDVGYKEKKQRLPLCLWIPFSGGFWLEEDREGDRKEVRLVPGFALTSWTVPLHCDARSSVTRAPVLTLEKPLPWTFCTEPSVHCMSQRQCREHSNSWNMTAGETRSTWLATVSLGLGFLVQIFENFKHEYCVYIILTFSWSRVLFKYSQNIDLLFFNYTYVKIYK